MTDQIATNNQLFDDGFLAGSVAITLMNPPYDADEPDSRYDHVRDDAADRVWPVYARTDALRNDAQAKDQFVSGFRAGWNETPWPARVAADHRAGPLAS